MGFKALSGRLPEWGRLFDEPGYDAFQDAVREELSARGPGFELHDGYARIGDWELPLLPLAQLCAKAPRSGWRALLREQLERRFTEEKLGKELDSVRGNFDRARPALKLRVQRAETLRPGTISAPIAGQLHAALVLDLPSPATPYGALVAMPSGHIVLCHAIADARSLRVLPAMAAGALQAWEGGPAPLSPDLFWKRGDRFVALPVVREDGEVRCELHREFDEQVAQRLC